jgi:hypothetical protein
MHTLLELWPPTQPVGGMSATECDPGTVASVRGGPCHQASECTPRQAAHFHIELEPFNIHIKARPSHVPDLLHLPMLLLLLLVLQATVYRWQDEGPPQVLQVYKDSSVSANPRLSLLPGSLQPPCFCSSSGRTR